MTSRPPISARCVAERLANPETTLLEALPQRHWSAGHIPGAKRVNVESAATDAIEAGVSKRSPVLVYCTGPTCSNSQQAADALIAAGFEKVAVFEGGKEAWLAAGYSLEVPDDR
ncbi:MAG: rhodanese-like domain-containing protein [Nannocystaceae bacterium]|nr:rhodanese-like domain-containing protein [Nannocystaceae bacterium]